jgi:hypothetical protein
LIINNSIQCKIFGTCNNFYLKIHNCFDIEIILIGGSYFIKVCYHIVLI